MIATLLHWIAQHGYGMIFLVLALGIFGLPLPNDLILAYLGYLIFKGKLYPIPAFAAAFLGSLCGMMFNYALGRTFGLYLVRRFGRFLHITDDQISRLHRWFEHSGRLGLVIGYFLPGVRHVTAFIAGTSRMIFWEFVVFSSIGGALWSVTFIVLGYVLEEGWSKETARIHHVLEIGTLAAIAIVGIYFLQQRIKKKKRAAESHP